MPMSRPVSRKLRIVLYMIACVALLGAKGLYGLPLDDGDGSPRVPVTAASPSETRPPMLTTLYVTFAGLQVLDVHTTLRASSVGGQEANPVIRSIVGSPPLL